MKTILSLLSLCLPMLCHSQYNCGDDQKLDEGILGKSQIATPLISTDSIVRLIKKIDKNLLLNFNSDDANHLTIRLEVDEHGNLKEVNAIYNFKKNQLLSKKLVNIIQEIKKWNPAISIAENGTTNHIPSTVLLFIYFQNGEEIKLRFK